MRRESATVVVLAGEVSTGLLAGLAWSPNISLVSPGADLPGEGPAGPAPEHGEGWEPGARAMREAARRRSTYVLVAADPLAGLAAEWRAMWDLTAGQPGASGFETAAAQVLAAWRGKQFELPDYYLIMAPPDDAAAAGFYLGPLRAARPRRIAVGTATGTDRDADGVLAALRSLEHGPWWPPLDELIAAARTFYPGGLAETQLPPDRQERPRADQGLA